LKEIQTHAQVELIPGPWYVPDKLRTGARVQGLVESGKQQATSNKQQALDSWSRILYDAFRKREKNMITDKEYKILMTDVYRKIITAVNITTGDDGTKAHKVIETFNELWKMNKKEYEQQQKYFG